MVQMKVVITEIFSTGEDCSKDMVKWCTPLRGSGWGQGVVGVPHTEDPIAGLQQGYRDTAECYQAHSSIGFELFWN